MDTLKRFEVLRKQIENLQQERARKRANMEFLNEEIEKNLRSLKETYDVNSIEDAQDRVLRLQRMITDEIKEVTDRMGTK